MNENEKVKAFKDFKQALSLMPYGDYYFKSVLSHLDKISLRRKINLNIYYDTENQWADRFKFFTALLYIESSDNLPGKIIKFDDRTFENCVFYIDNKIKMKCGEQD